MEGTKLDASESSREMNEGEPLKKSGESSCNEEAHTVEPLSSLAGVALAPSCDQQIQHRCTCDACCCPERDMTLHSANLQMHVFMSRAENIHKSVIDGVSEGESLARTLTSFLFTCQPYFTHLESITCNNLNEKSHLSKSTYSQLLRLSETLVNKLENMLLTFGSNDLISLDETDPHSISHFHIGQFGLGPLKVTIFRYCQPTPYLGQVNTGLFKRMRWNVDRMDKPTHLPRREIEVEIDGTEYYFLCFEDISALPEENNENIYYDNIVRVWSIGQWIQVFPQTSDINDWVLCKNPQGTYQKRVILGSEEPSCRIATDCLQQLLMLDLKSSSQ